MFYCDPCAKEYNYPETIMRSYGQCEICDKMAVCNSRAAALLPKPKRPKVQDVVTEQAKRIDTSRLSQFMSLFTKEERAEWARNGSKAPDWVLEAMLWFMEQDPGHQELMRRLKDS